MNDAKPYPKSQQLARGERRYWRKIASPKQWQAIIEAKRGSCRVCETKRGDEMHHLVPRAQGGEDTADNIVPLCFNCHAEITAKRPKPISALISALSDAEYAYAVTEGGENVWERIYGVTYDR